MKKLLVIMSVAALVVGCRTHHNENTGGMGNENTGASYGTSGSSTSTGGTTGGTGAAGTSGTYNTSTNLNNPGTSGTSTPQQ